MSLIKGSHHVTACVIPYSVHLRIVCWSLSNQKSFMMWSVAAALRYSMGYV